MFVAMVVHYNCLHITCIKQSDQLIKLMYQYVSEEGDAGF